MLFVAEPGNSLIFSITAIGVGCAGLIISWWLRRGGPKSRFWLETEGIVDERFAMLFTPGISALFFGMGMFQHVMWMPAALKYVLATFFALVALVGLILLIWGIFRIPYPSWFLPQWLVDYNKHNPKKPG
ncbi:MAG: hypothetical protein Q4P66_08885 [Actinomycetaceae bacterium]|nr:hypothetical protein [Actinomycetaceae bacterium]